MTRFLDIVLSIIGLIILFPIILIVFFMGLTDTRSPIFFQERVGKGQKKFILVKFRTMLLNAESVPTHLVDSSAITPFGKFLRKSKLDELPQLLNVLKGDMSFVGPRPCLFNQEELIAERLKRGVYDYRPGITGLAQINGIDMSSTKLLARTDALMLKKLNVINYFRYIFLTLIGNGLGDKVKEKM